MKKGNEKKSVAKIIVWVAAIAITVAAFVFSSHIYGENSIFNKAVSGNSFVQTLYGKIPALIRSIQIITIAMLISIVLNFVMVKLFAKNNRGITIVKLLNSF